MPRRNRMARAAARAAERSAAPHPSPIAVASGSHPGSQVMDRIQPWAPAVARVALGLVLLWFGIHELIQPSLWTGYVPAIPSTSHLALALVLAHGWALSVLGVALCLGVATRLAAALSALALLEIVISLSLTGGVTDIVARDLGVFGLAVAVLASDQHRLVLRG
ncbi:MAG: hypothetical protein ACYCS9_09515 [Candidatus Dormibacteria bacterium]